MPALLRRALDTLAVERGGTLADARVARRLLYTSQACALLVAMVGALGLVGWQADIALLKRVHPDLGAMAPGSAMALVLSGIALWLLHPGHDGTRPGWLAGMLPWPVLVLSGLTLVEYLLHVNLGIDQLLFPDPDREVHTAHPGRISAVAALGFTFLGTALLLIRLHSRTAQRVARLMVLVTSVMLLVGLLGLLYGRASLYAIPVFRGVAVHTIAALLLLAAGILAIQPARGFSTLLASAGAGGRLARRLLPFAFVTPLALGWLRLQGERAGLYQGGLGVDLMVVAMVALFVGVIWWHARLLDIADTRARRAQAEMQDYADEVRDLYERAPCGYHSLDARGTIVRINDTELSWLGYAREEVVGILRFEDLLTPESRPVFAAGFAKFRHEGMVRDLELDMRRKDGSLLPVSVSATGVCDADGNYLMIRSTVFDITERRRAEQALRESEAAVRALSLTDALTGLANRRRLDEGLRNEVQRVHRYGGSLSAVIADLDHFKEINDTHGHEAGDELLRAFAQRIREHCREVDLVSRFGGEEFVILMPEAGLADAQASAERIRTALEAEIIPPLARPITASFGVAELEPGESAASLLRRADKALYQGKASGRNCVVIARVAASAA